MERARGRDSDKRSALDGSRGCLALLLSSFLLGFAAEWVARDAGIPVKFRLLGISLGWPGVFASAWFLVAFHALSIRTKPAA
jgi:hypothetical protein